MIMLLLAMLNDRIKLMEDSMNKRIDDLRVEVTELRKYVRTLQDEISSIKSAM